MPRTTILPELLASQDGALLSEWTREQASAGGRSTSLIPERDRLEQSRELLALLQRAVASSGATPGGGQDWDAVRDLLSRVSRARALQGASPSETATFVLSLKRPLFERLRARVGNDASAFGDELWATTMLLDQLALFTTEIHQKNREEVISRQQQDMLELSTPVVKLWEGILALPVIGTLDSARTQVVMETLLARIVETGAEVAIIDITGVITVDTLVAQHLLKTITAARLMGADCIISGIRPQIAQTIVHLGVDLQDVTTKATLADAFKLALERTGQSIRRAGGSGGTGGAAGGRGSQSPNRL